MLNIFKNKRTNYHLSDADIDRIIKSVNEENNSRVLSDEDVAKIADVVNRVLDERDSNISNTAKNMNQINKSFMVSFIFVAMVSSAAIIYILFNMAKSNCLKLILVSNCIVTFLTYVYCWCFICKKKTFFDKDIHVNVFFGLLFVNAIEAVLTWFCLKSVYGYSNFLFMLLAFANSLNLKNVEKFNETRSYNLMMFFISMISLLLAVISLK